MNRLSLYSFTLPFLAVSAWSQTEPVPLNPAGSAAPPMVETLTSQDSGQTLWTDTRSDSQSSRHDPEGYYPTSSDLLLLGDYDYRRSGNLTQHGPDFRQEGAMGIFEYESGPQDFFTRNQDILQPADQFLGLFTPHKPLATEFGRTARGSALLDADFPIFTRTLSPESAHLKLGPLAFDLLWIGTGMIWSDFNGPQTFGEGNDDGWIGYVEVAARGYLQFTETLHLSWLANLVYLPWENELALRNGYSSIPSLSADILYQFRASKWDFILFDRFYARPGLDIFTDLDQEGIDQAGRYRFGFYDRNNRIGMFEEDFAWFVNQMGIEANRMFFNTDWRFRSEYTHWDMWRSFNFDDHTVRDTLTAQLGYEGNNIPFAPMIAYTGSTYDGYESFVHRVYGTLNGRITENVRAQLLGGYYWTTDFPNDNSGLLWGASLFHDFSKNGQHSISGGQNVIEDQFSPEALVTQYVRYNISYRLTQRLQASAFAQHTDGERLYSASGNIGEGRDTNFYLVGGTLTYRPLDFTNIVARAAYQSGDTDDALADTERWLYRIQLMQRLASRLVFETFYQFEDFEGASDYDEHAVGASLRWFF